MIHHSALSYNRNSDQFKINNNYHRSLWNFKSFLGYYLGYNYEIAKRGRIRQARKDGERTAACYQGKMNDGRCIHICLDGNFDIEKPAPKQIYALRDLVKRLVKEHGINKDNIVFHKQYAPKSCPGQNMDLNFVKKFVSPNVIKEKEKGVDYKKEIIDSLEYIKHLVNKL